MLRSSPLRLVLSSVFLTSLLSSASFAQSQDAQSVADAARRAREQKKPQPKPAKVITDEDIKPAPPAVVAGAPATPDAAAAPANATSVVAAPPAGSAPAAQARDQKDQPEPKEVSDLKAQIKQALDDLRLVLREESLEEDKFYSNTDYAHDNAGKAKIDDLKQQASEKQVVLDRLKARLAELLPPADNSTPAPATAPPKP